MAIKLLESYEHRVYTASHATNLVRRATNETRRLSLADDFYIRPATSSRSWRVVFEDEGATHVYTIDEQEYNDLMRDSTPMEDEKDTSLYDDPEYDERAR